MSCSDSWIEDHGSKAKSGGQGTVVKVKNEKGIYGALKRLHEVHGTNTERRQRMAREMRILEKLDLPGIPRIYEHNAHEVDSKDSQLYFVSQWIEGKTLQEYAGGRPINLTNALKITRDLAGIIMHCHNIKILHRDIKPNNIIIASDERLYLVDFGIAYTGDENHFETHVIQELGNRFLRLPELMINASKHDPRADVTMALGVLFFLITGRNPITLVDENNLSPHISQKAAIPVEVTQDYRWKRVKSIFDIGFTQPLAGRFRNAEHLITALDEAIAYSIDSESISMDFEIEINQFNELLASIDYSLAATEEQLVKTLNSFIVNFINFPYSKNFNMPPGAFCKVSEVGKQTSQIWSMSRANSEEPCVHIYMQCNLNEDQISIDLVPATYENQLSIKLFSVSRADLTRIGEETERCLGAALGYAVKLLAAKTSKIEAKKQANTSKL